MGGQSLRCTSPPRTMASSADSSSSASGSSSGVPTVALVSTGCERDPNAVHWRGNCGSAHPQGLIAYAANTLVAIYDPNQQTVIATLRGHAKKVNCVQWVRQADEGKDDAAAAASQSSPSAPLRLVSGGVDEQIIVWQFDPVTRSYTIESRLRGHEGGVSAVSALSLCDKVDGSSYTLLASTASDLTVRIWINAPPLTNDEPTPPPEAAGWQCIQVLPTGRHKLMHCLDLTAIPVPAVDSNSSSTCLLTLSVGGVDSRIHLWLADGSSAARVEFLRGVSLAGHENWIRSLEWARLDRETAAMQRVAHAPDTETIGSAPLVSMMLASASQDKHIRLWKLQVARKDAAASGEDDGVVTCTSLGSRGHVLSFLGLSMLLVLESVLSGHDNWVMCARWQPPVYRASESSSVLTRHQPLSLLSASTDKTMCIWRPSLGGIWSTDVKVGEMGGHTLGFYGCAFAPEGDAILANGYSGSFHLWRMRPSTTRSDDEWTPAVTVSGHAASVNDLCWDAQGDYLLTTSSDQTTRLWAPWQDHKLRTPAIHDSSSAAVAADSDASVVASAAPLRATWHEISRPQLHGYDLHCLCPLYDPTHTRAHSIASGAEEKVVRVFWAPLPFIDTVKRIAGVETIEADNVAAKERPLIAPLVDETRTLEGGNGGGEDDEEEVPLPASSPSVAKASLEQLAFLDSTTSRAVKANLPELGLSNKALMDGESANALRGLQHVQQEVSAAAQLSVGVPPPEDYLLSTTLWPEVEKLYGHGYEIVSIACNHAGTLLASACVAKKSQHAVVRVWQTTDWAEVLQLEAHRSSVVTLAFSPDDRYLLTGSKDRHVAIFELRAGGGTTGRTTALLGSTKLRAHGRIVWSVSWAPLVDGPYYFASGSRDKTVRCFRVTGDESHPAIVEDATLPPFACAVTALAFAPLAPRVRSDEPLFSTPTTPQPLTLAVGMEDGRIELWQTTAPIKQDKMQWTKLYAFPDKCVHHTHETFAPPTAHRGPYQLSLSLAVAHFSLLLFPCFHHFFSPLLSVCHGGFVKRLSWRWRSAASDADSVRTSELELASCGQDQSVRIFAVPAKMVQRE